MSVVLVNGDGNPAVYASQDADLLGGIGGQETGILDINNKFAATIADANTVEISSGVCITKEGRRIQIDVGDVEEVVVPTGSQGTTKYYIIGFHLYTDGSGNQLAETFIDEVASPSATITEKMFKDGETEVYVSLYRITRNGLNLEGLTLILPEIGSLAGGGIIGNTDISGIADGTLTGAVAKLNTDLSWKHLGTQTGETAITFNLSGYRELLIIARGSNSIHVSQVIPVSYLDSNKKLFASYDNTVNGTEYYVYVYVSNTSARVKSNSIANNLIDVWAR